jgi:hypothetical protein
MKPASLQPEKRRQPQKWMRRYAGVGCVALGIFLSAFGLDSGESMSSRMDRLLAGWSVDWLLLIPGILSLAVGLALTSYRKSRA